MPDDILANLPIVLIVIIGAIIVIYFNKIWASLAFLNYGLIQKVLIWVIPIVGLAGIVLPALVGMYNYSILGSYMAVPMVCASLLYQLFFYKKADSDM